ncbi:hypothetical protein [Homoserinibacter sp. GY 40078]|uniref:hypothetical protein n=1 Tax=Homoserinibacter sp. GY 40078 TaxID=2603275 RepID=UPI0011CC2156|nr:hypothetical protein [Homoserinibacter sp. GY 40078]TXK19138.1 hypothetical protein FVQ89_04250 [Homoserinibacter sp. GY 40078]
MYVALRIELAADADHVWNMLRSPEAAAEIYAPVMILHPETDPPARWSTGDAVTVRLTSLGIPVGRQLIDVRLRRRGTTRIFEDVGKPLSGALARVTSWRHRMAVTPLGDGRCIYRDRLDVSAGPLTPLLWIGLWTVWQWRGARIRRLATAPTP